jgi:KamA family protein
VSRTGLAVREHPENLNSAYQSLAAREGLLPIKVTPFYQKKVDEEVAALGGTHGPLYRAVYPVEERLTLHAPNEVKDWVGDRANMDQAGAGYIIQKYEDRVLFLPTSVCAAHCLYCFRQDVLSENKNSQEPGLDEKLEVLRQHLRVHPKTREVILSGGDPLMLSAGQLEKILAVLREMETVQEIRLHTRAPVFAPSVLTEDKICLLAENKVRVVFHIIHPYEVCGEVETVITRLHQAGVRLYNHFPLLRKTNDHADVLCSLITRLENLGVRTYSVYVPEPIPYSASTRLTFRRACKLIDEVKKRLPGWADFRFCLDTPAAKVGREHLIASEDSSNTLVFFYDNQRIRYPDFLESMDEAGDVEVLLWKEQLLKQAKQNSPPSGRG